MDPASADSPAAKPSNLPPPPSAVSGTDTSASEGPSNQSASGISLWAKSLKIPQALRISPKSPTGDDVSEGTLANQQPGFIGTLTKGIVDSSKSAVKAVSVKARHAVSQNKRRFQEDGFDLDMTYITENIIAMGFPAGDMSSGFFGYVEGFYRNHMEEVIQCFETRHKNKYKVYNLCSERLYDASLFEGKVASFPFDDHNCPPIQLITSFCQSAYSWLKQDIENVVVVHCKAGMARTGLMICSLLVYLKFFPTSEESMDYYNQKRCIDGKGLVLPSQIRYVKYFERVLTYFNGEIPPARRCMLRGFRLHRCPYWIRPSITISDHSGVLFSTKKHPRTKDLSPEDFWFTAPKKGVMVFALPGEPGLTELNGDFKIHFHDRQGDFYCWLNTTMTENRKMLNISDLDGFDKRKLPSPGFQVEVVLVDYNGTIPPTPYRTSVESPSPGPSPTAEAKTAPKSSKESQGNDKDDVFSDSEAEEGSSKSRTAPESPAGGETTASGSEAKAKAKAKSDLISTLSHKTKQVSLGETPPQKHPATETKSKAAGGGPEVPSSESDFKVMAADASVFTFGDEDDYDESE